MNTLKWATNMNENNTQTTAANTPEVMLIKELWVINGKRLGKGKPSAEVIKNRVRHRVTYPKSERYDPARHGLGEPIHQS